MYITHTHSEEYTIQTDSNSSLNERTVYSILTNMFFFLVLFQHYYIYFFSLLLFHFLARSNSTRLYIFKTGFVSPFKRYNVETMQWKTCYTYTDKSKHFRAFRDERRKLTASLLHKHTYTHSDTLLRGEEKEKKNENELNVPMLPSLFSMVLLLLLLSFSFLMRS